MFYTRKIASLIPRRAAAAMLRSRRMTSTGMTSTRVASADEQGTTFGLNQELPPPSYIVVMEEMVEEGLPSYEEAVMKQDMVSEVVKEVAEEDILPAYEEVYRVQEEGTEVTAMEDPFGEALDEVLEEALDEVKVEEAETEIAVLEETLEEMKVAEEKLNSTTVVEVKEKNL